MEEDNEDLEGQEPEEPQEITPQQLARFRNLKAFSGWSDEAIRDYIKNRPKKPTPPQPNSMMNRIMEDVEEGPSTYNEAEYQEKYDSYFRKYMKDYAVDMNETNDVQALQSLVRFVIQAEIVDKNIIKLQGSKNFSSKVLKDMGDFQRSIYASMKEIQEQLGISRKARKDKQADDIPQYIRALQVKAAEKWKRSTQPIVCEKCHIELARYWLNFPDKVLELGAVIECDKCGETVVFSA